MGFEIDTTAPSSPFAQLREQIRRQVAAGELLAGTRLPTVRSLASELGLAANTVARAYRELEGLGVIETRGRAGSFVSGDTVDQAAREAAHAYAERARVLGLGRDQAVALVHRAFGA